MGFILILRNRGSGLNRLVVRFARKQWLVSLIIYLISLPVLAVAALLINDFATRYLKFESSIFKNLSIFLIVILFLSLVLMFYNSRWSWSPKRKIRALLSLATERLDFLKIRNTLENKRVEWRYKVLADTVEIWLFPSGTISADIDVIGVQLQNFLIATTHQERAWTLREKKKDDGIFKFTFGNRAKRLLINSIESLKSDRTFQIWLDSEKYWKSQNSMLVVGGTGSGKTTLLKVLTLLIFANSPKNEIWCIDGKGAYISNKLRITGASAHVVGEAGECDPVAVVAMLEQLDDIMNNRYKQMSALDIENDSTYIELFPNAGTIVLLADELLALVATMQAADKQRKPAERLEPRLQALILNLLIKGRQASIRCIISGQALPVSVLGGASAGSTSRDNIGARIVLGSSISQVQAQEIFNYPAKELEATSEKHSGWIWLDGEGWQSPKAFLPPEYDDEALPFGRTLRAFVSYRKTQKSVNIVKAATVQSNVAATKAKNTGTL